jgi:two-component system sensor histidine kinase BaeS
MKPNPVPLYRRLFISFLSILFLGMGVAALVAWRSVEALYLETQRENLLAQAQLTAAALEGQPLPTDSAQPYSQTANVQPGIHSRMLSEQGAVLIGLPFTIGDISAPLAENNPSLSSAELIQRPEIVQALSGKPLTAIRRVPSAGNRRVLYAAAPVYAEGGTVVGLIYLATPLPKTGLPTIWLLVLAGAILAAILVAAIASTLIAHRISRPIEAIASAAAAVSAGDFDQQVPVDSGIRELDGLGQDFNRMTGSLRQSELVKSAFVADVTHELRTPLTVIKGTLETLEDGALYDTEGRGPLLASMQRETDRLIRLVNDLLVLTRADAGALNLNLQPLDLGELARARCEHFDSLAAPRQVTLSVSIDAIANLPIILGDSDRLAQVIDNLLDNAIRYSPDGSTVDVVIRQNGSDFECSVHDQGSGIEDKHLPMIFDRFYRADGSRNRQTGGAGLGLAIARALVDAHGGCIDVESIQGKGTTLRFILPACSDCPPID